MRSSPHFFPAGKKLAIVPFPCCSLLSWPSVARCRQAAPSAQRPAPAPAAPRQPEEGARPPSPFGSASCNVTERLKSTSGLFQLRTSKRIF